MPQATGSPSRRLRALAGRRAGGGNPSCCAGGLHAPSPLLSRERRRGNLLCDASGRVFLLMEEASTVGSPSTSLRVHWADFA